MKIKSYIFLFIASEAVVCAQANTNQPYTIKDIATNNDFVTIISPNPSQDIFDIKSNLTQSEYNQL